MNIDLWKLDNTCRKVKRFKSENLNHKSKIESDFWIQKNKFVRLRNKERTVDALALIGDEGRD